MSGVSRVKEKTWKFQSFFIKVYPQLPLSGFFLEFPILIWLNQWSQHSVSLFQRVVKASNFYAITNILEENLVLAVLLQNFYQILVQYLNFLGRANFVSPNYWSHSLLYNFEGLKCLNSVPLVSYYKSIYIYHDLPMIWLLEISLTYIRGTYFLLETNSLNDCFF